MDLHYSTWSGCVFGLGHVERLDLGLLCLEFGAWVDAAIACITEFVQRVVVHRKDFAIRVWKSWVLEDPLVHPYKWLRPDLFPPAPFLSCDPRDTVDGSGVLVEPHVF